MALQKLASRSKRAASNTPRPSSSAGSTRAIPSAPPARGLACRECHSPFCPDLSTPLPPDYSVRDRCKWPALCPVASRTRRLRVLQAVAFDLWYCDNVFFRPRVTADWNDAGADGDPNSSAVAAAYRACHRAEWDHIRRIDRVFHYGQHRRRSVGAGIRRSARRRVPGKGYGQALVHRDLGRLVKRDSPYRAAMANTRAPHLVGFNVHGDPLDYRFFRYAYASCLLDDGYFCFTAKDKEYSSVTWFDEFDLKLGAAVTPPPTCLWQERGLAARHF